MSSASIYKIRDRVSGMCYIGCTTLPIDVRIYQHEKAGNPIMANKTWEMEILEKCPADCRFDREAHWIAQYKDYVVNKVGVKAVREERPNRLENKLDYRPTNIEAETKAEYNRKYKTEVRKKEVQAYNQDYYDKNRARLTEKKQCGCGGRYCVLTKSTHMKSKMHIKWELETELEEFMQEV